MALHEVFPEFDFDYESGGVGRLSYPRPISEPPSPTSSRATTPLPSDEESGEEDEVDEEREVRSTCFFQLNFVSSFSGFMYNTNFLFYS